MAHCEIIPLPPAKACSGKCKSSGGCTALSTVWVLAACEGMAALFRKQADGQLLPLSAQAGHVSSFEGGLRDQLIHAAKQGEFKQLLLVGSANDIAWTQASLPTEVSKYVVAEIEYPLMAAWFGSDSQAGKLAQALRHVLEA